MGNEYDFNGRHWVHYESEVDNEGNESTVATVISIMDVPVKDLVFEWENLVVELSDKEIELCKLQEQYNRAEFEIVYVKDIDFKGLYGSTAEKVRKQHAKTVLANESKAISDLELSINWIRQYIPLLKEVIRGKR